MTLPRAGGGIASETLLAAAALDDASRALVRLCRVRGASHRTRRRIARAAAVMLAAAGLVAGASLAAPAQAANFSQFPFGLANVGSDSSHAVVDIDGDGDRDVFIGAFSGAVVYFENTGSTAAPAFARSSANPFGLTAAAGSRSSPAFVDIDGDGDFDAFVGGVYGNVPFFENTGSSNAPAFAAPTLANPFGLPTIGPSSVPAFADIDGDGDFDAFFGSQGQLNILRNTGSSTAPAFADASANFGLIPFGLMNPVSRVSPAFADIDNDGDLDAFMRWNTSDGLIYYPNTGSSSSPAFAFMATLANPFGLVDLGGDNRPAFADIDGDGDLDAFMSEYYGNTIFYDNTGNSSSPAFAVSYANPFDIGTLFFRTDPAFADLDGDGDHDAFIGRIGGVTVYFQNNGSSVAPAFAASSNNPFGLTTVIGGGFGGASPAFVDIDGDGDIDAFIGAYAETVFFRNTGTSAAPTFAASSANPFGLTAGLYNKPAFADIDADGDLDAFIGEGGGSVTFFRNTGASTAPAFGASSVNPFGLTNVMFGANPTFIDMDGDGDLDAVIGQLYANMVYFENTGSSTAPAFAVSSANPFGLASPGPASTPVFVDIDGDGDLDAFSGNIRGETIFFQNGGCGNGLPDAGEECDDGNAIDDDACNTLCQTPGGDVDDDGVTNAVENAGVNGGDGNGDGKPDSTQAHVATLPSASGAGSPITIVGDPSCPLEDVEALPLTPTEFTMPFGGLAFRLPNCSNATLTIYYHGSDGFLSPPFQYVKQGPNPPGAANDVVYTLSPGAPHFTVLGSTALSFDPAVAFARFTLADGVVGDDTGVDGTIFDQGGPGFPPPLTAPALSWRGLVLAIFGLLGLARRRLSGR